jgi:HEAT repeat protein
MQLVPVAWAELCNGNSKSGEGEMSMGFFKPNIENLKKKKDLPRLIKALSHKDADIRANAAAALGWLNDVRAVEPLVALLGDRYVRMAATKALAKIADESCVDGLIIALNTADEDCYSAHGADVRYAAVEGLGRIGHARAVKPLIRALRDGSPEVHQEAGEALRKIGPEAVDQLIAAVKDTNQPKDLRFTAATIVGKIGGCDDPIVQAWDAVATEQWDQAVSLGDVSVEPLLAIRRHWANISLAAKALAKISPDKALIFLLEVVHSNSDEHTRAVAEGVIAEIAKSNVDPLVSALKGSREGIRSNAAKMLRKFKGSKATNALIAVLKDSDPTARDLAACELGFIRDPRAVDPLISLLSDREEYATISAVNALSKIGDKRAERALFAVLKDRARSRISRNAAFDALKNIGASPDAFMKAWSAVEDGDWPRALSLGNASVEPLVSWLEDASLGRWPERKAAAEVLKRLYHSGKLGDAELKRILSVEQRMKESHHDARIDYGCFFEHSDYGIGVSLD